jgi:Outer membrane lipoprotein-sorting protein
MSKERTSVFVTVVLTTCVTAAIIFAGLWFLAPQYLNQPTASAPTEVAPAPAPAPRRGRSPQGSTTTSVHSGRQDRAPANEPPSLAPASADSAVARGNEDAEPPSAATREAVAPAAEVAALPSRAESGPSSAAAPRVATAAIGESHHDARTIMEEAQRRAESRSYQYDGQLEAFDGKGKIAEKRWTLERLGSHGQSKTVVRFSAPPEVKGVALLIFNHPNRASDQWMWTPAIERDRRIAMQDRSTRFFGTDFSFEDLEERDVDQFDFSMLGVEAVAGVDCWKIQSTPKQTKWSQYTSSIVWVRKDNQAATRVDNFVKDEVVRRLTYSNIENIQGIWTARQLEMTELRRGSRTRLTLQQVKYNVPLKDDYFTLQAIRHP